jgi:hypothetical protein
VNEYNKRLEDTSKKACDQETKEERERKKVGKINVRNKEIEREKRTKEQKKNTSEEKR